MQHKNQEFVIEPALIDEMAELVLELPGIAVASEMSALKEQHLADYQESKRFEAMAISAQADLDSGADQRKELAAEYNRTFDKIKSREDKAYRLLQEHRKISEFRAEFGGKLGVEARRKVKLVLTAKSPEYVRLVEKLGELTENAGKENRKADRVNGEIKEWKAEAVKLMASSEDLFKQIQALRAKLNE